MRGNYYWAVIDGEGTVLQYKSYLYLQSISLVGGYFELAKNERKKKHRFKKDPFIIKRKDYILIIHTNKHRYPDTIGIIPIFCQNLHSGQPDLLASLPYRGQKLIL